MKYLYFTKGIRELNQDQLIEFVVQGKLDGLDLAVRPGYPITPENAKKELPSFAKNLKSAGGMVGLVTAPTDMIRPDDPKTIAIFEAAGAASVPFVKIGYFPFRGDFHREMKEAQAVLKGFERLAQRTGARALYHTHSGSNLGCNGVGVAWLLQNADPHSVGVLLDPGHLSLCGGPFALEYDAVRTHIGMLSLKDMAWNKVPGKMEHNSSAVIAGKGMVAWDKVAQVLKKNWFDGMASIHAEYEAKDLAERKRLLAFELDFFKSRFP